MKRINYLLGVCLIVCIAMVTNACVQNEEYKNLVIRLVKAGNSSTNGVGVDAMREGYKMVAAEAIGKKHADWDEAQKNAKVTELVEKYVQERALEDLAESMLPYYEKNLDQKELEEYIAVCESARFQEVNGRVTELSTKMLPILLMGKVMVIAQGKEPEALTPVACADSYKQAFKAYFENSGTIETFEQTVKALSASMMQGGEDDALKSELLNKMTVYMKDNIETAFLNSLVAGEISEEDLNYLSEIASMPACKKILKSAQEMMGDAMGFGQNIMMNFATWLEGQKF